MDPRLLAYYNQELQFVREAGAEFAAQYPKIAGRLGIDVFDCDDPYVERLFEGFAFLAARVQLKLDAEFPRFTQHLLEMVCPHYLAPQPSMTIVEFEPDLTEGGLADGFVIPRDSSLKSLLGKGEQTRCVFRTARDVTLWPITLSDASYLPREVATLDLPEVPGVKAALMLTLEATAGLTFREMKLDRLPLYIRGSADVPTRIYEQLLTNSKRILGRPVDGNGTWINGTGRNTVRPVGFEDDERLLPYGTRSFQGYRLLQEYFAFPQRYMFVELDGLQPILSQCDSNKIELIVLLGGSDPLLANRVDASHFSLFSCPAVNLFPKRADRIHLNKHHPEHHVVVDRTRPMDFEVYQISKVTGHGTTAVEERQFSPFYQITDEAMADETQAYFAVHREPRVLSANQKKVGTRSNYVGSEVFVSLVDREQHRFQHDLRQLSITALCTNRDLPIQMPVGVGTTDFTLEEGAPVQSIRCLLPPTRPRTSKSFEKGQTTWRLISHLSLNYLSICDDDQKGTAAALRELLALYSDNNNVTANKQIDGIRSIQSAPVTRPIKTTGPMCFGRGLEVILTLDDSAYEGTGAFLMAAVLERFLAKYVSINSFTETVFNSTERGEVMRWPAKMGHRSLL
ncbi:MAG: type VI secretion system baseplate subunit TssF [Rhodopirellula sp.]|nr:type VI secretion system baseplate subunit TssF [Rhodopirellula sp.]